MSKLYIYLIRDTVSKLWVTSSSIHVNLGELDHAVIFRSDRQATNAVKKMYDLVNEMPIWVIHGIYCTDDPETLKHWNGGGKLTARPQFQIVLRIIEYAD